MIEVVGGAIEIVGSAIEVVRGAIEIVAIDDGCTVGDVGVVVKHDCPVGPVASPVVPSPAETGKEAYMEAEAKGDGGTRDVQSRIGIPARPHHDWRPIN